MSTSQPPGASHAVLKFTGTPTEIGADLWIRLCLPAIQGVARQSPDMTVKLYAGFFMAAAGSMSADFGHEQALEMMEMFVESFAGMGESLGGSTAQQPKSAPH